jgi:hypothetical protein
MKTARYNSLPIANCPSPIVSQAFSRPILTHAIQLAIGNWRWAME